MTYYHKIVCNKDFGWLYELTKVADTDTLEMMSLMFLRFLALCVQNGSSHPLDHPLIARLTSQYGGDHRDFFSLTETIIQPIKILEIRHLGGTNDLDQNRQQQACEHN